MSAVKKGITVFCILIIAACKNPTEDLKVVIDTDIIKYTALIHVTDASNGGPAPANASISISGPAASDIYEVSGKKEIRLSAGIVTIGLGPGRVPDRDNPANITVEITAPGYNKVVKPVSFTATNEQQIVNIGLIKTGSTTPPVVVPPPPVYNSVTLNFKGKCSNRSDIEIRPSIYVFFRKAGTNSAFQYLGYMNKGNITTKYLALGETYEFQIAFGGENYEVTQKIEMPNYSLTIDMGSACDNY